ncbi:MAG TPA: MmgE/PrpD family protein, partial [Dehalococcoidales bacterium]
MSATQELVKNVVRTSFESLDQECIEKAKLRILDAIGCAIAGANAPGCQMLLNLVRQWGGTGESTIIAHGGKAPAHNVAMMNSLMTRSFDFEPVEAEGEKKTSPAHISGTTIPVSLAVAEQQSASGKDLITALAVGDDLASRLGVASGFDFNLGWDNTGTINMFGATAIAGKLLRLDEKQVMNAFGIALNQLAGSMAGVFDKTVAFKLPIALASRDGIFAAELAKQGFGGVKEPFLGPRGYFALYCRNYNIDDLAKDIGKRFYADCVIKPYSACRATHPAIDCALEIARNNDIKVEDIEEIVVHITPGTLAGFVGQPFAIGETPQVDSAFSIRYTVATALLRKNVKPEYYTVECIHDPQIQILIDRMKLVGDIPQEKAPATEIQVKTRDGNVFVAHTDFPKGDFRKTPLTVEEIRAKYRSNVTFS